MSKRAELDLSLGARVPVSALPPAKTPPPAKRIERLKQTRQLIVILDRLMIIPTTSWFDQTFLTHTTGLSKCMPALSCRSLVVGGQ